MSFFKKSKFKSQKTQGYDSKKEYKRSVELKHLEQQNIISDLKEQVVYVLLPKQEIKGYNGKIICGRREMKYIADFVYNRDNKEVVEDCKGYRTTEYKKKKNLMKKILGIEILET